MQTYIFNFDIHGEVSEVYQDIKGRLKNCGCQVLGHPLGSTYLIRTSVARIEDLCVILEEEFKDLDMAFVLSRYNKNGYCKGATMVRKIIEEVVNRTVQKIKEIYGKK